MLKALKLRKLREIRAAERAGYAETLAGLETRLTELRSAMEQAQTEDDIKLVEDSAAEVEKDIECKSL